MTLEEAISELGKFEDLQSYFLRSADGTLHKVQEWKNDGCCDYKLDGARRVYLNHRYLGNVYRISSADRVLLALPAAVVLDGCRFRLYSDS